MDSYRLLALSETKELYAHILYYLSTENCKYNLNLILI